MRLRAIVLVAAAVPVGLGLIYLVDTYRPLLEDWIAGNSEGAAARIKLAFAVVAFAIAGPLLGFSAYLWRFGRQVVEAARFPPPNFTVVRDTTILSGEVARRRGRRFQLGAGLLAAIAIGITVLIWRIARLCG
jgi:hypothetical protein